MVIEERHLAIVLSILQKYPYSFFAFGSRVKGNAKRLSDLDLCFFESIPSAILMAIEEDFEESDLPYKVDLVNWHMCDKVFQRLILQDMITLQASADLLRIEKASFRHFRYLPELLGRQVSYSDKLCVINGGGNSSMFRIVASGGTIPEFDACFAEVSNILQGHNFAWWISPTADSNQVRDELITRGLVIEAPEYAMILNLRDSRIWMRHCKGGAPCNDDSGNTIHISEVHDAQSLQDFISVLEPYDSSARAIYEMLTPALLQKSAEKLFVLYENNQPVTIAALFYPTNTDTAGIFSVITKEAKRRKGYASAIMQHLIAQASGLGAAYVTLSASNDDAMTLYERLGFRIIGKFQCFEWKNEGS